MKVGGVDVSSEGLHRLGKKLFSQGRETTKGGGNEEIHTTLMVVGTLVLLGIHLVFERHAALGEGWEGGNKHEDSPPKGESGDRTKGKRGEKKWIITFDSKKLAQQGQPKHKDTERGNHCTLRRPKPRTGRDECKKTKGGRPSRTTALTTSGPQSHPALPHSRENKRN